MRYKKFRDTIIDPNRIEFLRKIEILEILNYPHAGNDVLHCVAFIEKIRRQCILKISRQDYANFENESCILESIPREVIRVPEIFEYGKCDGHEYLLLEYLPGNRINEIVDQYQIAQREYCERIGSNLAMIHSLGINANPVKERRFHKIPQTVENSYLSEITDWLECKRPKSINSCFVHGDHHYANLLWEGLTLSATLDWELSGYGNKEFDIAWATLIRSPDFLNTVEEEEYILNGYASIGSFDRSSYDYYKAQLLCHRLGAKSITEKRKSWIQQELEKITGIGK